MAKNDIQLASGEKILFALHRHWVNVLPVFISAALVFLLVLFFSYGLGRNADLVAKYVPVGLVSFIMTFLVVLMLAVTALAYLVYSKNRLILTNRHLVEITWNGIFDKKISQFSLERLQNVSSHQVGWVATMLGYGEIIMETAGDEENFTFHQVPNPQAVSQQIMVAHEAALKGAKKSGV